VLHPAHDVLFLTDATFHLRRPMPQVDLLLFKPAGLLKSSEGAAVTVRPLLHWAIDDFLK
jgi:hypothetical protein